MPHQRASTQDTSSKGCRSLDAVRHLGDLLARLDEDKVRRGRQFERICKWFLTNDPLYKHQVQHVWLWDEWLDRWGADAGIDLIVEDRGGGLWAVQAKAYDPNYSVTKADVDTFLSESSRSQFSYGLLIATTNRVGTTARRTLAAQEKQAGLLMLADLEAAQVEWPSSPAALRPKALKRKRPRPHQREAIRAVVKGFAADDRGQLIMACGTGKTLTALFIAEKLNAKRTLVLVPSLSLLAQTLREWTANASEDFDCLAVCSDQTVIEPDAAVRPRTWASRSQPALRTSPGFSAAAPAGRWSSPPTNLHRESPRRTG